MDLKKVIERLNFKDFERNYQNEETGRPAISPKKVISALFYSILIGNHSMRELCRLSKLRAELIYLLEGIDFFSEKKSRKPFHFPEKQLNENLE
ncbi:hypothetical protein LEP1GSC188_0220 [Leptospira weilii serovar Topaz str. LT2116]|uniref:Transposase InsH N-terminal domain-containing protein n=1 Tax=Leptospira weilii serovar Topaz str. LT2116 TaxID=1088540 RepID=M3G923_9LEPT|nr:hypothetical protein LEP1GSC188_0220 [Leptospira weilii serovar Topaz str. LT2116]